MPTISQVIDEKRQKIIDLERELELQRAVLLELQRVNPNGASTHETSVKIGGNFREGTMAAHIFEVLKRNCSEMTSADIVEAVEDLGVTTMVESGLAPSVAAALSKGVKSGRFVRVRTGVYKLGEKA